MALEVSLAITAVRVLLVAAIVDLCVDVAAARVEYSVASIEDTESVRN